MKLDQAPSEDFTAAQLPHTRFALFGDILKLNCGTIVSTSALLTLFALPLASLYLVFNSFIGTAAARGDGNAVIFSLLFYAALIAIPCIALLFIGLTGSFEVAKHLSFGEGVLTSANFFYGLKGQWKRGLAFGFIVGLSFAVALVGSFYLLLFAGAAPIVLGIGIGLLILQFVIITTMGVYFLAQDCLYENGFGATFKNAFLFTLMRGPWNLCLFLLSPGLFLALVAINDIGAYIAMALFVLFNFVGILAWTIYAHGVFDRYINKDHYPQLVDKGLSKRED